VTAQGSPATRFARAIEHRSVLLAEIAARELGRLSLEQALELVILYGEAEDKRYERAALRFLARAATEQHEMTLASLVRLAAALVAGDGARARATLAR
jgi:hypothetical protein